MFLETERRALAGRSARDQRAGALFDLPVHKAREGRRVERPVAEWRHQGGNRTRKHVSLLYKNRAGPIESGRRRYWTSIQRPARSRSEEHTSELQSLMRISYAVFCLKKKKNHNKSIHNN